MNDKNKKGKILLITGGTGSFGNAVLDKLLDSDDFSEIRIFSRDEKKQDDMRQVYQNDKIKYYIGDARDRKSIDQAMFNADIVYHAAALKQVPSCEFFPMEAVLTNIAGTENVLDSAIENGIKKVIFLSTDKAVYPINAMGQSKALAEKVMVAKSRNLDSSKTVLCCTRYGNVMGSRGSVIPLFIEQIKAGKPVTITDPNMTRFMMTMEDAMSLVLYTYENGRQGDILVQKAPACTIETLALALIDLYNTSNNIKIIGTRHGEKLFETLVNREEIARAEDLGDYYRIPVDTRNLNYGMYFTNGEADVAGLNDYTSHNTTRLDVEEMKKLLLKLPLIRKDILEDKKSEIHKI